MRFGGVEAALIARIPVVHLAGGDTSEGAFDESMRHAITKMSHLHFVTNDGSAERVRQMGENPANIHQVGSTSLDYIKQMEFMTREAFFDAIGFTPRNRNLMVTFHPVTLDPTIFDQPYSRTAGSVRGARSGYRVDHYWTERGHRGTSLDKIFDRICSSPKQRNIL